MVTDHQKLYAKQQENLKNITCHKLDGYNQ